MVYSCIFYIIIWILFMYIQMNIYRISILICLFLAYHLNTCAARTTAGHPRDKLCSQLGTSVASSRAPGSPIARSRSARGARLVDLEMAIGILTLGIDIYVRSNHTQPLGYVRSMLPRLDDSFKRSMSTWDLCYKTSYGTTFVFGWEQVRWPMRKSWLLRVEPRGIAWCYDQGMGKFRICTANELHVVLTTRVLDGSWT